MGERVELTCVTGYYGVRDRVHRRQSRFCSTVCPHRNRLIMPHHTLLLEFDYETLVRPSDIGASNDTRLLAVGYRSVTVTCEATGRTLGHFELSAQFPPGFHPIYGFSNPEPWGVWSEGKRSCFLLELCDAPVQEYRINVSHMIVPEGGPGIRTRVLGNARPVDNVVFNGSETFDFLIRAEHRLDVVAAAAVEGPLRPDVPIELSIVIVNYNAWALTSACIASLLSSGLNCSAEILVLDNGSSGCEFAALERLELPIQLKRFAERRSFGEANNFAAERARGSAILFLNNDAFVQYGCIDHLANALAAGAFGVVGAVLEYPDGRLQEAGAFVSMDGRIVHRDHSNIHGDVRDLPAVSAVDYVSGACLMIRRDEFIRLGGFDPLYEPAYNEDVDLCFQIRAGGKRAALVRDAHVLHIRNATLNKLTRDDPHLSAPALSQDIFRSRWGAWLWTREACDLPLTDTIAPEKLKELVGGFPDRSVNAVFSTEPLSGRTGEHTVALSAVLSRSLPTILATDTPYSQLRLLRIANGLHIPMPQVATAAETALNVHDVEIFVHSTCEMPPAGRAHGKRRFLHCPMPIRAQRLTDVEKAARIQALSGYEAIVTNSELAKHKLLGVLRYFRAAAPPIIVIAPPLIKHEDVELESKENLIICIGDYGDRSAPAFHDFVLRGFQKFQTTAKDKWQLVCLGDIQGKEGVLYLQDLRSRAAALNVRCVASPDRRQATDLLRRAKICVSGTEFRSIETRLRPYPASNIGHAISHGCVPILYARSVEAELCAALGMDLIFDRAEEIEEQIAVAAHFASERALHPQSFKRAETLTYSRFYAAWQSLLCGSYATKVQAGPSVSYPEGK